MKILPLLSIVAILLVAGCSQTAEEAAEPVVEETFQKPAEALPAAEQAVSDIEADLDTSDIAEIEEDLGLLVLE